MMSLDVSHRSDVATELLDAGALVVGSPTMNNQIYPTVADLMTYLRGLKPRNRIGATFGSYGWSGEAVKHLDQLMQDMKVELVQEGLRVKYVPDDDALAGCHALGVRVAETLKARAGAPESSPAPKR
jgi:flavorubredoxin